MKKALCEKIHMTDTMAVLAIAGGGSEAIGELLRHGNGSKTLLDAQVPYSQTAFEEFIGGKPDKFVSEDAACSLALAAFLRARKLHTPSDTERTNNWFGLVGIGATASLAKENERSGREHRLFVACQTYSETRCTEYVFPGNQSREEEEEDASNVILSVLGEACHLDSGLLFPSFRTCTSIHKAVGESAKVVVGQERMVNLTDSIGGFPEKKVIFPGSFNPIHAGHMKCAELAAKKTGQPVHFEISCRNVDKPGLHYKAINERLSDFLSHKNSNRFKCLGDLYLTDAPLFAQKVEIFKDCTFVVGYDTFARISDCKYYESHRKFHETLDALMYSDTRWIVFPRLKPDGQVSTDEEVKKLPLYNRFVTIISREEYDPLEVAHLSSREIRGKP